MPARIRRKKEKALRNAFRAAAGVGVGASIFFATTHMPSVDQQTQSRYTQVDAKLRTDQYGQKLRQNEIKDIISNEDKLKSLLDGLTPAPGLINAAERTLTRKAIDNYDKEVDNLKKQNEETAQEIKALKNQEDELSRKGGLKERIVFEVWRLSEAIKERGTAIVILAIVGVGTASLTKRVVDILRGVE